MQIFDNQLSKGVRENIFCIQTQLKLCHKISKVTLSIRSDSFSKSIFLLRSISFFRSVWKIARKIKTL